MSHKPDRLNSTNGSDSYAVLMTQHGSGWEGNKKVSGVSRHEQHQQVLHTRWSDGDR